MYWSERMNIKVFWQLKNFLLFKKRKWVQSYCIKIHFSNRLKSVEKKKKKQSLLLEREREHPKEFPPPPGLRNRPWRWGGHSHDWLNGNEFSVVPRWQNLMDICGLKCCLWKLFTETCLSLQNQPPGSYWLLDAAGCHALQELGLIEKLHNLGAAEAKQWRSHPHYWRPLVKHSKTGKQSPSFCINSPSFW